MKAVNLLGPQLHALESFSKDQMKQYFVHFANWALQGDMDTKKVMVTEGYRRFKKPQDKHNTFTEQQHV